MGCHPSPVTPSSVSARNSCRDTNLAKSPLRPGKRNHSWPVLEIMSCLRCQTSNGMKKKSLRKLRRNQKKKEGWRCELRETPSVHYRFMAAWRKYLEIMWLQPFGMIRNHHLGASSAESQERRVQYHFKRPL